MSVPDCSDDAPTAVGGKQRKVYPVPSLGGMPKGIFTGKADHENKFSTRMQDDMVMALGFGINYALDLCADPPFARLRTKMNPLY